MATKIFWSDTSNENLEALLKLDIEKLFEKYDQLAKVKNLESAELQETIETLNDVKNKLKLQIEQRELYEKQHCEMMKVLNIPTKNQCFSNILPALRELKESFEKNEIAHYEIAESVLKSQSFANRD